MSDNNLLKHQLKPVDSLSLVDKVELRLMEYIAGSEVKPGDALPKEVDLADAFGVSRTVVREALTRLRMMGLVDSLKHKGSVVSQPDVLMSFERVLHPQMLDEDTLKDIFEMRLVLEVGMADLVFSRITEEDIKELEEMAVNEPEDAADGVFDPEFEVRFHGKLYQIAGNHTLQRFQKLLLPVFQHVHESGMLEEFTPNKAFVSHRALVEILRNGTAKAFSTAIRKHLETHFKRIL